MGGPEGGLPRGGSPGIGPPLGARGPAAFPGSAGPADGRHGGEANLPPSPFSRGVGGRGKAGGAVWNGLGRRWECPSPSRAVEDGGRGGVTNPASKPGGIGENANAAKIDRARGPSTPRRVDLSEGGSPESVPHRARRRWGAAGNRPAPILESAEAAMALAEERRECGESAEGTPLRRRERSGAPKSPDRR